MKINYPIKYVATPIIEPVRLNYGLNEPETICYIVSKCYLISKSTIYKENGTSINQYDVVFPYQLNENNNWERTIPSFNLYDFKCTNSSTVAHIFNSYEDALNYVDTKNAELCKKSYAYFPSTKNIQSKKEKFNNKLQEYKMLEQQIMSHTTDLDLKKRKELLNVIMFKDGKVKELPCNLYEIINVFDNENFLVYTIDIEQYDSLKKLTPMQEVTNIKNITDKSQLLLCNNSNDSIIKVINSNTGEIYYLDRDKKLHNSNNIEMKTDSDIENTNDDTYILYTTENIEDLINSYKSHEEIDLSKIHSKTLKK